MILQEWCDIALLVRISVEVRIELDMVFFWMVGLVVSYGVTKTTILCGQNGVEWGYIISAWLLSLSVTGNDVNRENHSQDGSQNGENFRIISQFGHICSSVYWPNMQVSEPVMVNCIAMYSLYNCIICENSMKIPWNTVSSFKKLYTKIAVFFGVPHLWRSPVFVLFWEDIPSLDCWWLICYK